MHTGKLWRIQWLNLRRRKEGGSNAALRFEVTKTKITIEGEPKEIAAIVSEIQQRQAKEYSVTINASGIKDFRDIVNLAKRHCPEKAVMDGWDKLKNELIADQPLKPDRAILLFVMEKLEAIEALLKNK